MTSTNPNTKQRVLDAVNADRTIKVNWLLADKLGLKESTVSTALCALAKEGKIQRIRKGNYAPLPGVGVKKKSLTVMDLLSGRWFRA